MLAARALIVRLMTRGPKPCRSAKPGWAPIETPFCRQSFTVSTNRVGALAWKPQATLADFTIFSPSASLPITRGPKLSPRSELMLTNPVLVAAILDSLEWSGYPSRCERSVPVLRRHCLHRRIRQRNLPRDQRSGDGAACRHRPGGGGRRAAGRGRDRAHHPLADGELRPADHLAGGPRARDRRPDRPRPAGRSGEPPGLDSLLLPRSRLRPESPRSRKPHQKNP